MTITYREAARPVVWLLEGSVEINGNRFPYWYQYDERDGEVLYEFTDKDPDESGEDFDFDEFQTKCQEALEKSWDIVGHLSEVSKELWQAESEQSEVAA